MKLSAVYKSPKRADTYLYVEKRDDFSKVPQALLTQFGSPQFVMLLAIEKHDTIATIDKVNFVEKMQKDGFYLQMPPHQGNLLKEHIEQQGKQQRKQQTKAQKG
jgi:uncharacterized protein YcgL (UPF0745 family)